MKQTPVHQQHNPDLLSVIPKKLNKIIEVGCSSGALAREYKRTNPNSEYLGIEISEDYAKLASKYCDKTIIMDIECADDNFYLDLKGTDCWVFGDTLEHLKNPWAVLQKIKGTISENGYIAACIPNAQHWSIQARLSIGDFRYQSSGLMDITHLRWFTRQTIIELFSNSGFSIEVGFPRIFAEPERDNYLPIIGLMAKAAGADPEQSMKDAIPLQYVILAKNTNQQHIQNHQK